MKLNCAVIHDLLPLYLEEMCSDETKALVETHLEECQNCREAYRRMTSELFPEPAVPREGQQEGSKPLNAKKVIKRLRRRGIALLLCALLIVPVVMLSVNQARGTGLSFTAIPYVIRTRAFMSAVTHEDYEKAFAMVDAAGIYESNATPLYADFSEHPLARYHHAEIGGGSYYVSDSVYKDGYAAYLEDGDEVQFWCQLLLFYGSRQEPSLVIPEKIMSAIEQKMVNDEEFNKALGDFLSCFSLLECEAGSYYIGSDISEEELTSPEPHFPVLPAFYYDQAVRRAGEDIGEMNNWSAGYAALGLETYKELSREVFTQNLESLAKKGIAVTDWRLTDIYVTGDGIYHITCALNLKVNSQPVKGTSVELAVGKNGIISSTFQDDDTVPFDIPLIRLYIVEQGAG